MTSPRTAIIGGGYCGLSAAYELSRHGARPIIYEAASTAGGLARCLRLGGAPVEAYYHHWFNHDRDILGLVRELGLKEHLSYHETHTATLRDNAIHRLSSPMDVLRFRPLRMVDRLRLARLALAGGRVKDFRRLEGISAQDWITKLAGRRVYEVVWRPLFEGKFGRYADEISAVWFWTKLQTRGRSRSVRQREQLVYLQGGLQRLTNAFVKAIVSRGGQVHVSCPVRTVRRVNGAWEVVTDGGGERFDQVLVTVPTPVATDLLEELPDAYRRRAASVPYLGVTELMLVLNRPLSDTYWLNVNDPGYPFVGVIEHTNFQPTDAYGGRHIVYLTKYRDADHETVGMPANEIFRRWTPHVARIFPEFEESAVQFHHVWQDAHAQPVVRAGCESEILPTETPLPGVSMCTMAQIYPEDRGTNYAVRQGREVARHLMAAPAAADRRHRIVRISWTSPSTQSHPSAQPLPGLPAMPQT